MRRFGALVLLCSCQAHEAPTPTASVDDAVLQAPVTDTPEPPAGPAFWCFDGLAASCGFSQEQCAELRAIMVDAAEDIRCRSCAPSACEAQPRAACIGATMRMHPETPTSLCYPTFTACERGRGEMLSSPEVLAGSVSDCEAWHVDELRPRDP